MAITVQSGTPVSNGAGGATTITPPLPADVVAGDLLLLILDQATDTAITSGDAGWISLHTDAVALDRFRVYTKIAGSSESAPTITYPTNVITVAVVVRIRGWDTGTGAAQATAQQSATTTASIDPPTPGSAKFGIVHVDPATAGTVSWATATEIAELAESNFAFLSVAYKMEDTAGALAFTWSGGASPVPGTLIFSIAPDAAPAAPAFVPQIVIS